MLSLIVVAFTFVFPFLKCQSSAAPLEQADFLKGAPHRNHPGVTNLKTVHLPEQLQVAAQSVLQGK